MPSEDRRVRLTVRGRVQGVMYRASAQKKARGLGLKGWVKNLPDGAVLLEAQGPAHLLEQLEAWCREGPPMARVTDVKREEVSPVPGETSFDVTG